MLLLGWVNYGEYRGSIAAFLFQFPPNTSPPTVPSTTTTTATSKSTSTPTPAPVRPIKLAKIGGAGLAQIDDGSGPKFGSEGLTIPLQSPKNKMVRSKLGLYYEKITLETTENPPKINGPKPGITQEINSILPNNAKEDELCDLKVYVGIYEPGEKIPYSDALPFSLN